MRFVLQSGDSGGIWKTPVLEDKTFLSQLTPRLLLLFLFKIDS